MEASSALLFRFLTYIIPSSRGCWRKLKRCTDSTGPGRCACRARSMISSISGGGLRGRMVHTTTTTTIITTSPLPCLSTLVDHGDWIGITHTNTNTNTNITCLCPFSLGLLDLFVRSTTTLNFVREGISQFHHVFMDDEWRCMTNHV